MKHRVLASLALSTCGAFASVTAQAQCVECAQQMFQATLTSNIWYGINQDQIDSTRRSDARNGVCYDANRNMSGCDGRVTSARKRYDGIPDWTANKAKSVVMNVIKAEYAKRQRAYGNGNAGQWLNTAASDIARQMSPLESEYFDRFDASDRKAADDWYLAQVRRIAEDYASGHRGPGLGELMYGKVPASTRKQAEDATFAVIDSALGRMIQQRGREAAIAWAREMGLAIGSGVKNLAPEYAERSRTDGRASADEWYVQQAGDLARLQVSSGG